MNQLRTKAIILSRTDFGEADRIVTLLTPDHGKLRLMARGVRRVKSKLAGGVELFSVSDITFVRGRGDIGTLISARLDRHFGAIVHDLQRVQLGYELIKIMNTVTEDSPEPEYFKLLLQSFEALDDAEVPLELIKGWFQASLLTLGGHAPNLRTDAAGQALQPDAAYNFDLEAMTFVAHPRGGHQGDAIKTLRLLFADHSPRKLAQVQGIDRHIPAVTPLVRAMFTTHVQSVNR